MLPWPGRFVRKLSVLVLASAVTAALAGVPPARAQDAPDLSAVDTIILRLMSMYDIPGVAVALIQNGKIILTKGYGYRDVAARAPVTGHTLFSIGSVTKSFTALGIAQLVDRGKLDLDTPVVRYVPELRLADPQVTKTVTLRHLLSHTSGLPREDSWIFHPPASRKQVVEEMAKIRPTAKPGERFQYCNQNFVLAGYIVERMTGQSWEEYTREHVFAPLRMTSAQFDIAEMGKTPDFAHPYLPDVLLGEAPIPLTDGVFKPIHAVGPAGSITASALDMAQYALFQLGDGTFQGQRVVSKEMLAKMHRAQIALNTDASPEGQVVRGLSLVDGVKYGFGWLTEEYRGVHLVQHGGAYVGFVANVTLVPSAQAGAVVLANATGGGAFIDAARLSLVEWLLGLNPRGDIAAEINSRRRTMLGFDLDQYKARVAAARAYKVTPAELARWAGDYDGPFAKVRVTAANDRLFARGVSAGLGKVDLELIPFAPDSYLVNHTLGTVVSFKADEDGVVTMYRNGSPGANRRGAAGRDGTYTDPRGRFHIMAPAGVRLRREGSILVFRSATPPAMVIVTSADAGNAALDSAADRFVARALPGYTQRVIRRDDLAGLVGRQAVYALPTGQVLVVEAVQQRDRVFLTALFGAPDAIRALTPTLAFMILSFRVS